MLIASVGGIGVISVGFLPLGGFEGFGGFGGYLGVKNPLQLLQNMLLLCCSDEKILPHFRHSYSACCMLVSKDIIVASIVKRLVFLSFIKMRVE